jgi:hypothetical protein
MDKDLSLLKDKVAHWMQAEHGRVHGIKRIEKAERDALRARASEIIDLAKRKRTLRALVGNGIPLAIVTLLPSARPRVRNQKSLFLIYDRRRRHSAIAWLRRSLRELARTAPRFTQIGLSVEDDQSFRRDLEAAGFKTRYEILMGETKIALKQLIAKKNPASNLDHLGLELKEINSLLQIPQLMRLQKQVSLEAKRHAYFSHTPAQLKKDREEYVRIINKEMGGRILGIYRREKLLGLMVGSILTDDSSGHPNGGFTFFLHPSIQGKRHNQNRLPFTPGFLSQERSREILRRHLAACYSRPWQDHEARSSPCDLRQDGPVKILYLKDALQFSPTGSFNCFGTWRFIGFSSSPSDHATRFRS